jgi:hypothetical protein
MSDVVEARKDYEQAQVDARALVERARLNLGKTVYEARRQGVSQDAIAKELELTREQVRRFQREYEDAERPDGSVETARLARIFKVLERFAGVALAPAMHMAATQMTATQMTATQMTAMHMTSSPDDGDQYV